MKGLFNKKPPKLFIILLNKINLLSVFLTVESILFQFKFKVFEKFKLSNLLLKGFSAYNKILRALINLRDDITCKACMLVLENVAFFIS